MLIVIREREKVKKKIKKMIASHCRGMVSSLSNKPIAYCVLLKKTKRSVGI
jgi:hypothetical protein